MNQKLDALIESATRLCNVLVAAAERYLDQRRPVRIWVARPTLTTKEGKHVATPLQNDLVYSFPIQTKDDAGNVVSPPAGDTFSAAVTAGNASSYGVAVSGTTLTVTPLVQVDSTVATVTVSDQDGLQSDPLQFTIGPGSPADITVGTPTTTPQPIPGNPGPG